jgi:hypothetical protein
VKINYGFEISQKPLKEHTIRHGKRANFTVFELKEQGSAENLLTWMSLMFLKKFPSRG